MTIHANGGRRAHSFCRWSSSSTTSSGRKSEPNILSILHTTIAVRVDSHLAVVEGVSPAQSTSAGLPNADVSFSCTLCCGPHAQSGGGRCWMEVTSDGVINPWSFRAYERMCASVFAYCISSKQAQRSRSLEWYMRIHVKYAMKL